MWNDLVKSRDITSVTSSSRVRTVALTSDGRNDVVSSLTRSCSDPQIPPLLSFKYKKKHTAAQPDLLVFGKTLQICSHPIIVILGSCSNIMTLNHSRHVRTRRYVMLARISSLHSVTLMTSCDVSLKRNRMRVTEYVWLMHSDLQL